MIVYSATIHNRTHFVVHNKVLSGITSLNSGRRTFLSRLADLSPGLRLRGVWHSVARSLAKNEKMIVTIAYTISHPIDTRSFFFIWRLVKNHVEEKVDGIRRGRNRREGSCTISRSSRLEESGIYFYIDMMECLLIVGVLLLHVHKTDVYFLSILTISILN